MDTFVFKRSTAMRSRPTYIVHLAQRIRSSQQSCSIHGGGLIRQSKANPPSDIQVSRRWWLPCRFNPLSPCSWKQHCRNIVSDIEPDAWAWLREQANSFGIDRNRVAILATWSADPALMSGYNLTLAAARASIAGYGRSTSDEFIAPSPHYVTEHRPVDEHDARRTVGGGTISASGPVDLIQRFLGRGLFYLFCRQTGIWFYEVSGHDPHDHDWFAQYQPFSNISAEYPPTMLLHGQPDTDVLIEESVLMQQELIGMVSHTHSCAIQTGVTPSCICPMMNRLAMRLVDRHVPPNSMPENGARWVCSIDQTMQTCGSAAYHGETKSLSERRYFG